jgi:ferritin-like metal-binding protein YciE
MTRTLEDQLVKYLADAHAMEEQALKQLEKAADNAGDGQIADAFRAHLEETRTHGQLVHDRLTAHGASPSRLKDLAMRIGGEAFALFAKALPDTPAKLLAQAYSFEAYEEASYKLLLRVAKRAGDEDTAAVARQIREQEVAMKERLAGLFDRGAELAEPDIVSELADAHAIEEESLQLLKAAHDVVHDRPELLQVFNRHLQETKDQQALVERRLDELGGRPSKLKDAAMRLGAINWATFFESHPDTPGKLVAFAYAFEHLEIAAYELLRRTAERAGDPDTAALALRVLDQERAAVLKLRGAFDPAVEASLEEVGAGVR